MIAFLSAAIATVIGTMAAIGMDSMKKKNRNLWMTITNIPMLNAEIVTGISLMLIFMAIGLNKGFLTVLIAHITFNIPYVILIGEDEVNANKAMFKNMLTGEQQLLSVEEIIEQLTK